MHNFKDINLEGIIMKKLLFILPLLSLQSTLAWPPMDNEQPKLVLDVLNSNQTESVKLNRYENHYSLSVDDEEREIPNHMVSAPLRKMTPEQLAGFLQSNYITIKPYSDGSVALAEHGRLRGGGPWGSFEGYWAGKFLGQGVVIVSGYAILLGATGVVTAVGGREAGKEFFGTVQERSIPRLWRVSENISEVTGAGGALLGWFSPTP